MLLSGIISLPFTGSSSVRYQGWPLIPSGLMSEINGVKSMGNALHKVMGTILHGVAIARDRTRGKVGRSGTFTGKANASRITLFYLRTPPF